jgi:hypothetical protein
MLRRALELKFKGQLWNAPEHGSAGYCKGREQARNKKYVVLLEKRNDWRFFID